MNHKNRPPDYSIPNLSFSVKLRCQDCFYCQKAALIVKKRKAAAETTALRWILYHSFSRNLKGTVPVIPFYITYEKMGYQRFS